MTNLSEIQERVWANIQSHCVCVNDEGDYLDYCLGCYEDDLMIVTELIDTWVTRNGDKATDEIRIDGKSIGWQHLEGWKIVSIDKVPTSLNLNGDFAIRFILDGTKLTAVRSSHDELGADFVFSFVPEELSLVL